MTEITRFQFTKNPEIMTRDAADLKRIETAVRWLWNELDEIRKDRDAWRVGHDRAIGNLLMTIAAAEIEIKAAYLRISAKLQQRYPSPS